MYGSPGVYRPRGSAGRGRGSGGGGRKPSQQPPAYYAPRNPNYVHPATAPSPSSSFSPAPYHQQQNPSFQTPYSFFAYPVVTREMVEAAVAKVERDLLSGGENVSVWKVTQSAALALQISSWESIGFKFNDIPYLRSLQFVEGKVNSFIHCFVSVRRMTTVHDLGLEICKSEGVEQFEELGLGPLLRHPLVRHYFMIPSELKEVCSITIDDLMSALSTFLYKVKFKEITVEEFLTFLVEKYSLPARENLGVRIQSMGLYIKFLKGARRAEWASLKNIQENGLLKEKQERQTYLMPDHLISLSSLLDEGNEETNKMAGYLDFGNIDVALGNKCCKCCPAQKRKRKKQTSCQCNGSPFLDEFKLIGLKLAMFNYVSSENLPTGQVEKQDNYAAAAYEIVKIDPTKLDKLILTTEQLDRFAATWKGACQKHAADEVLALMLNIYTSSDKNRRKIQRLFLQYPAVGILNLAVS